MRNVSFRDNDRTRGDSICDSAEQLNQTMGLFKVDTGCAWDFPHEPHRIKSNVIRTFSKVVKQDVDHRDQNLWTGKIQVNLVIAERRP